MPHGINCFFKNKMNTAHKNKPVMVVLKLSWHIPHDASPIKFFISLLKEPQKWASNTVVFISNVKCGGFCKWFQRKIGPNIVGCICKEIKSLHVTSLYVLLKNCLHAAFNTGAMIAERTAKDSVKLIHSFLWRWLCFWLPLSHGSNPGYSDIQARKISETNKNQKLMCPCSQHAN